MAAPITTPQRGQLFFKWNEYGWSESYDFPDITQALAIQRMTELATIRAYLLATGAQITYGRLITPGTPRRTKLVITDPISSTVTTLTGPPTVTNADNVFTALMIRLDGESFARSLVRIRCMPDDVTVAGGTTTAPPGGAWLLTPFTVTPSTTPANWNAALQRYLTFLASYCVIPRKVQSTDSGGNPITVRMGYAIQAVALRGLRRVPIGRPFGSPVARRFRL